MSSWTMITSSSPVGWSTSSPLTSAGDRKFSYAFGKKGEGGGLRRLTWKPRTHLPSIHSSDIPGLRPSSVSKHNQILKVAFSTVHSLSEEPNASQESILEEGEIQEKSDFQHVEKLDEDSRTPESQCTSSHLHLGITVRKRLMMSDAVAGGYEQNAIIHKEMVQRLNSIGAEDTSQVFTDCSESGIESDSSRSKGFSQDSESTTNIGEDGCGQLEDRCDRLGNEVKGCDLQEETSSATSFHLIKRVLQKKHDGWCGWTRRGLLTRCIVPIFLQKVGLNFEHLSQRSGQEIKKPDVRLSNFSTLSSSNNGTNTKGIVKQMNDSWMDRSNSCSNSHILVPSRARPSPRSLWLQADADSSLPQSTLWKDIITIIGLSAFVAFGTYAFIMSSRNLKSNLKDRCFSLAMRGPVPCSRQIFVRELTDLDFETSVSKKPTFVLFYAPWCSHCQQLEHTWKDLACRLPKGGFDVQLAQIDAEKYGDVAEKYKVVKYPTLIFFKSGKPTENHTGARDVDSLMTFIDENYKT
ncbi:hypothetical protein R1sor_006961 [Riccia sorocarpa]|uniref:Thioredoxin domain-containing protein n=1 Tax=Riccia sorocarpa TaxID=122646 RepID=A0ABD3HSR7_9MARC